MYKYWVEKILRGFSKNFSVHNVPFNPIFVIILIKNQFITYISSVKSLLLNLYKILFNSLYRQKLSFKLYRCYSSTYISRNTHKNVTAYFPYSSESQLRQLMILLFKKTETEFNSTSFMLSTPVTKFNPCWTKQFTLSSNCKLPCTYRVFPASGILCNNWCNIFL